MYSEEGLEIMIDYNATTEEDIDYYFETHFSKD